MPNISYFCSLHSVNFTITITAPPPPSRSCALHAGNSPIRPIAERSESDIRILGTSPTAIGLTGRRAIAGCCTFKMAAACNVAKRPMPFVCGGGGRTRSVSHSPRAPDWLTWGSIPLRLLFAFCGTRNPFTIFYVLKSNKPSIEMYEDCIWTDGIQFYKDKKVPTNFF